MQLAANEIQDQSINLKFTLNEDKCKEMRVCFAKLERSDILPVVINNKEIELTFFAKILGLIICSDLKWNDHVESVLKKSSKRLYFLRQLKRARVSGLQNLHNRRDLLCRKTFKNIVEDPNHKLHSLLPPVNVEYQYNLRNKRFFRLPNCKTNRFKNTFMIASASQY